MKTFEISLDKMKNSFQMMQNEAHWDISKKMFWGYYFLDPNHKKLEDFSLELKKDELEIVEIRQTDDGIFLLHVEQHIIHTPESLFKECHRLAKKAEENNIEIFDGWDVEPVQMNKGYVN